MNKIIIVGPSGSGKDTLKTRFMRRGYKFGVPYTSRPPRPGEYNRIHYNFITDEDFWDLKSGGKLKFNTQFNGWNYGLTHTSFEENNLFIMTPSDLFVLNKFERFNSFVIYLNIDEETRKQRLIERNVSDDSIERRMNTDLEDFKDFKNYDLLITNPQF